MKFRKSYEVNGGFDDVLDTHEQKVYGAIETPNAEKESRKPESASKVARLDKTLNGAEEETKGVGVFEMFKFSDKTDVLLLVVGICFSIVGGMTMPVNILLFGKVTNDFIITVRNDTEIANGTNVYDDLSEAATTSAIYFCIIAVVTFLTSVVQAYCWSFLAERQTRKIRTMLFDSILKQDVMWFDMQKCGELNARFSDDIHQIKEGMGEKVGVFIRWSVTWLGCGIFAVVVNWKLALAALTFSPVMVLTEGFCAKLLRSISVSESKAYAAAGAVAEQAISSIRTVQAFGGQRKEFNRYSERLRVVEKTVFRKGAILGVCLSGFWTINYALMALCFWYGTKLFQEGGYSPGDIIPVFFGVMFGSILLGDVLPYLENFATARVAAANVFKIIEHQPRVNRSLAVGEKPTLVTGTLSINGITFNYPARPDVTVLRGTSFDVPNDKTVALVGSSGSGKSTLIQLLQRFYDPDNGAILLDGKDIRSLNLKWYRDQIGVVSQEPILFATTIAENIRYGREGVSQTEIETAAREANAHDFITEFPEKYQTVVGARGQRLSGGQKQRIAMARALVKNPKFLFLDEATSALDNENEVLVQKALDAAQTARTTLIIAHRLSTIKNADNILVLEKGQIVESGSHAELMEKENIYYRLVTQQTAAEEDILMRDDGCKDDDIGKSRKLSVREKQFPLERVGAETESTVEDMDKEDVKEQSASLRRLISLNSPEWLYIVVGSAFCILTGCILPALIFIFGEFLKVLSILDKDEQSRRTQIICFIDLGIAALMFVAHSLKNLAFVVAGSRLTLRLRKMGFESILRQDIAFFDDTANQVGHLTTRLSSDASIVHGATGTKIGGTLETMTTIFATLTIAFVYSWKLSLVIIAFFPVILFNGIMNGRFVKGVHKTDEKLIAEAGNIFSQVIDNITTVTSLNAQSQFKDQYNSLVEEMYRKGKKRSIINAAMFGFSACLLYFVYAAAFKFGAELVKDGEIEFHNVFRVFLVFMFGGISIGRESMHSPEFAKARLAAQRILNLVDRIPDIDSHSTKGTVPPSCSGEIDISTVQFSYPTRPEAVVFKHLDLNLKAGTTVAVVGPSGCGKSTMVQLMERFYNTASGSISLDHEDIKTLNLSWLRAQMGVVSQEPVLFDSSIAENIAYGDNSRVVSLPEIIQSARAANIHNFITSLPQGYDTNVGARGTQLSGGQKQRVAIARALVRNPTILLLDEATSALDTESEKVVQEALDKATEGRTCIVIAHRLSTIVNADQIAVINNGQIEEVGTHSELIARQGKYYELYKLRDHKFS